MPTARCLTLIVIAATSFRAFATEPPAPANPPSDTAKQADEARVLQDLRMRALGYQPKIRNGETLYCRREAQLGSRFTTERCATKEDIAAGSRSSQDEISNGQRHSSAGGSLGH